MHLGAFFATQLLGNTLTTVLQMFQCASTAGGYASLLVLYTIAYVAISIIGTNLLSHRFFPTFSYSLTVPFGLLDFPPEHWVGVLWGDEGR
jgi:hypothetical protein